MQRRRFIAGVSGAMLLGGIDGFVPGRAARAQLAGSFPRTLVNVMLMGGADFRHVFVPAPDYDPAYIERFWAARRALYTRGYSDYAAMFAAEYQLVSDPLSGASFGIHRDCGWLLARFQAGHVAVVSNALGSDNRRHDHSQLIADAGDPTAGASDTLRDGWGGRLVEAVGSSSNVVVVSEQLSLLAMGTNRNDRLAHVVHARDMRDMALPRVDPALPTTHANNSMTRALRAYYQARGAEVATEKPDNWAYRRFFRHYSSLDSFGAAIDDRLSSAALPPALAGLSLHNPLFARQCRNVYDCALASDILRCRIISMSYDGWDSHTSQQAKLSAFLPDILGSSGGLATLSSQLAANVPGANDNLLYVFASDFGRQLAANGSLGTDHGRGNYFVTIGNAVRGGVYGEMFPAREARPDPADSQSRTPFQIPNTDIRGLTSVERMLAKACDWIAPGTGSVVFPNAADSIIEPGVDLSRLLSA